MNAAELVLHLQLTPHPEGGYFRETYRAPLTLPASALPHHAGPRAASTAILFLLEDHQFSALHRIASDELWHFHLGHPLVVTVLDGPDIVLGSDLAAGQVLQAVVPAGAMFGARIQQSEQPTGHFSLVGCTVSPGFDFADFVMPSRAELLAAFPHQAARVMALTR